MSEENEEINDINIDAPEQTDDSANPTDPRRLTNIDWSKDTPRTAEEWKALPPDARLDWSIWHEIKVQHTFATIAILLEIIGAIAFIFLMDYGIGMSVLICIATLVLAIVTGVFSAILYRVLRAAIGGGLIAFVINIILLAAMSEGTLRMVLIVLGYILGIALMGYMEAKGQIGKKIPDFPGPKEPGLLEDIKKMRQEMKKGPKKPGLLKRIDNGLNKFNKGLNKFNEVLDTIDNIRPKM